MKLTLSTIILILTFSVSANTSSEVVRSKMETTIRIDKKKSKKHKRINRKRKKMCHKSARRNFAG